MYKLLVVLSFGLVLSGCSYFHMYHPSIEQGNMISTARVKQLHTGMSLNQVKRIMGEPILTSTFADNRISYVYTFNPGKGKTAQKHITLTFKRGKLANVKTMTY